MSEWTTLAWDALSRPDVRAAVLLLGSVLAAFVVDWLICGVLARIAVFTDSDLDDRLIGLLHRPVIGSVVLFGGYLAVQVLELTPELTRPLVAAIQTAAILVWAFSGLRIISALLDGLSGLANRVRWLDSRTLPLFDNMAKLALFGGVIYCLLLAWDLNVAPWLASAGIVGIAVGFAAKDSLANIFGGLFIIIDAPYQIGDFINLDTGERGRVDSIGLRSTRLITRDDVEITVPNAVIANAKIVNESGGPSVKSRVAVVVGVAYGSDVDRVRQLLLECAESVEQVLDDPAPRVRFTEMADSALIFRVFCWIALPELRGQTVDALNTTIYKSLNQAGIQIPFPQRDVHIHHATAPESAGL